MPKIKIKPDHLEQAKKITEIIENTRILKREFELEYGKWNFVVAGPKGKKGSFVIREGFAQHMRIHTLPVYTAAIGDPDIVGAEGIPLEDFVAEEIPDEMKGMEVYRVDPLRPLTVSRKWDVEGDGSFQKVIDEYKNKTPALIHTPDEKFWYMSVLKYLNECDNFFPDEFIQNIREGDFSVRAKIIGPGSFNINNKMLN